MKAIARVLLAGTLLLSGCTSSAADPAPTPAARAASQFGGTDLAWIEINIAMDEELLPLLEIVPEHSGSDSLQALALQVQGFTTAELSALRALHDQAGLPSENPHKGMPMPGMVTPDDVTKAAALTGKDFDAYVLKLIQEHLDQSQNLAESEDKSGVEEQTRSLATQILRTRELAETTLKNASQKAS
ncbi:DUF305 domain-containing protein [Paractinoplanes ferrugineus]|uniref:DUF305 domain-containing protein n=1 Tax=Paractinoplanes ferrugineus TaxID=113564 RepID=A0A919MLD5_9ACTN|nr:DUF305 domain-containing protein [Actinoplanes ferrugineus]GIE12107.1 DUF305 domain-containing protein [Actinoplanes ferrugineus]